MKHLLVGQWIEKWAKRIPDKTAIIDEDKKITYGQFFDRICALSGYLMKKGIRKGDRVGVLSYNCKEYLEIYFALSRIGAILVPLNYRLVPSELDFLIQDSEMAFLFFHEDLTESVLGIKSNFKIKPISIGNRHINWARQYDKCIDEGAGWPSYRGDISPEDPHILMYTSGSTGTPKGALLSQRKTFFNTLNADIYYGLSPDDMMIITRPMFHSGGLLVQATPLFYKGATAIIHRKVRIKKILSTIQKYGIRILETSATVYNMMLNDDDLDRYNLSSLRVLFTGGERVQVSLLKEYHKRAPERKR